MSIVRAYLRASTREQDAMRAKADLTRFAREQNFEIVTWYIENQSGASLNRPELNRLINEALPTDVLLIEQVDRLTRLTPAEWNELKLLLASKKIRVVSLDLPTSWLNIKNANDPVTEALLEAINKMMLDVLAAVACKDYQDRKRRQAQGIEKGKAAGKFRGKQPNHERNSLIAEMIDKGISWSSVCVATGCSRSTIKRILDEKKK